jgi:hypothetical protein
MMGKRKSAPGVGSTRSAIGGEGFPGRLYSNDSVRKPPAPHRSGPDVKNFALALVPPVSEHEQQPEQPDQGEDRAAGGQLDDEARALLRRHGLSPEMWAFKMTDGSVIVRPCNHFGVRVYPSGGVRLIPTNKLYGWAAGHGGGAA